MDLAMDPVEQAQRNAGIRAVSQVLGTHINAVMDARSRYPVNDTDLLTSHIQQTTTVPPQVRDGITALHHNIRHIIDQVSRRIEEGKYRDAEQAIAAMPLAFSQKQRAAKIVEADKRMRVSFQSLKVTVEFFAELNQIFLRRIERELSPQSETNLMLRNAILIYELTDFVIRYIERFPDHVHSDVTQLYDDAKRRIADNRLKDKALEQRTADQDVVPAIRDQTLEDIKNRSRALDEIEREWDNYLNEARQLYSRVDEIHNQLPTLEVMRANAESQINVIQEIMMVQFLKENMDAFKGTVEALKGFRLAPLTPSRVRRLLSIP